jgi:3-methylfumaryl-CoA hydratase
VNDVHEPVHRAEACSVAVVRRVAALLDLDPDRIHEGDPLPRGWQFVLMGADTRRSSLRGDGFPGLGVPIPDLGLPRLMIGARDVSYRRDVPIGSTVTRTSRVVDITRKDTGRGRMAVVTIVHDLHLPADPQPAVVETHTYLLLAAPRAGEEVRPTVPRAGPGPDALTTTVVPDETLLFQYSALGFNSHRIHFDRAWARDVEGFPDLVVNGGLATLLLTEFLRCAVGVAPAALRARYVSPLYCGRPITLAAERRMSGWRLQAFDGHGTLAVDIEVDVQ